jgi:hypothetical protein
MSLIQSVSSFTTELDKLKIPYAIIGGLAVFAYGAERTTFDVDFLIHGQDRSKVSQIAVRLKLSVANENAEVLQLTDILTLMKNVPDLDLNKVKEYADIFEVWHEILEIKKHV